VYEMPKCLVAGVVFGNRVINWDGEMVFRDLKNNLTGRIEFNPDKKDSWFSSSTRTLSTDALVSCVALLLTYIPQTGSITDSTLKEVSLISGSWLDEISFDDRCYWKNGTCAHFRPIRPEIALPSDCRYREDLIYLLEGNLEESQKWKRELENHQRYDRKLRSRLGPSQA